MVSQIPIKFGNYMYTYIFIDNNTLLLLRLVYFPVYATYSRQNIPQLIIDAKIIPISVKFAYSWWHHQMETFFSLLALYAGNSMFTCEFPAQRPVTRSFDVFFDLRLNKRLSKQPWGWWFETPSRSLWRHCNAISETQVWIQYDNVDLPGNDIGCSNVERLWTCKDRCKKDDTCQAVIFKDSGKCCLKRVSQWRGDLTPNSRTDYYEHVRVTTGKLFPLLTDDINDNTLDRIQTWNLKITFVVMILQPVLR